MEKTEAVEDPIDRFRRVYAAAQAADPVRPDAMTLATVGADGLPSARVVLLKGVDARGFAFFTNLGSRKARELAAHPHVALCFYWPALAQQVRVEGAAAALPDAEADAYHATRPRGSQISAWASRQSEVIASRQALLERVAAIERRFAGRPVPRPPFWSGYVVRPETIEFWENRDDRLHERHRYRRTADGWRMDILQP
jgi:pyridoxamine 5'-phosphate oxidase